MSEHIFRRHNKSLILYHLVCPIKYRRKVLSDTVATTLKECCADIAHCYELLFLEIGSDGDHVHFLIQCAPIYAPSRIVQLIKSITAKELFLKHSELKKTLYGGKFWTSGFYINTVGHHGNEETITAYVKNQGKTYTKLHQQQLILFD